MATYSTGVTASWGGISFSEVYDISLPLFGSVRKDRSTSTETPGWTDEIGTISISAFGTHNMTSAQYGTRKVLAVSGGGVSLTYPAVCTGVGATPELNGLTRYTFTAKLLDT